ncbi:[Fe-Fe] hydrogenase large subunit C-terminal domain-containing protein [Pelosinus sp. UFO1]|uniref:[Fe-Fe] hydrogenase large subunit C-terminal domain-containing protein n=1 Tax=Pelosinus sp. UFO1 TaxID=484770 RepID=UPI0004D0B6A5|nr:[Fe-Fe] hydrogenase large subunit C-terminal domain-containing protein [Pelosinus sp. UFO1]AIF51049.1 Ferredoxin hydrogenase [Pelosinus sp. UFO1]
MLNIKPRILYHVAKAAWEGNLFERREEICNMVSEEFKDKTTRRHVANQIRIAMGLHPHNDDSVLNDYDEEALMGMGSEPIVVANPDACKACPKDNRSCEKACPLGAITRDELDNISINQEKCLGEGHCIHACSFGALAEKSQFIPLIKLLKQRNTAVYASIAPAFVGQFGPDVTPGKLRSALLSLGFTDVVETALYADLITMKEAFEFDEHVKTDQDFMFTSCCCPVWIKLIENKFPNLREHISPSVSPMVASARVIKQFEPDAKVVFIGPCVAKKSEALLPDLKGAIDYVLTFQELSTIFEATEINPGSQEDNEKAMASWGGRVYAYTGGVSAAVATTLEKLVPHKSQKLISLKVDGIPDCQKLLEEFNNGQRNANFIEGMACKGGCVGGPGRLIPPEEGQKQVKEYGENAIATTPVENPQVYAILARLGHENDAPSLAGKSPMAELLARKLV